MSTVKRFGGIVITFAIMFGFFVLGFALQYPTLLFISLLCLWPLFWAVAAWTIRGLRDNYQLVPKAQLGSQGPRQRNRIQATQEEF